MGKRKGWSSQVGLSLFCLILPGHGNPARAGQPTISIGEYQPWSFESLPPPVTLPLLKSGHPGFRTNIIIDPYTKTSSVVEISTEDLGTGYEVSRTAWSGPGTLTLSTLGALVGPQLSRQYKRDYPTPDPDAEWVDVGSSYAQHAAPVPHPVLGLACSSHSICGAAKGSLCLPGPGYQLTCQCPPLHKVTINKAPHPAPTYSYRHRGPRSLRYYEECKPIIS